MTLPRRGERGFSLIEVLVTVTIVGITFLVFVGGIGTSLVTETFHRKDAESQASIRNFAEAIKAANYDPSCATALASYAAVFSPSPPTRTAAFNSFKNATTHSAPGLAVSPRSSVLVSFFALANSAPTGGTFNPPSTEAEQWDLASTGPLATARVSASMDDETWTATANPGPRTAISTVSGDSVAQTVVLDPAVTIARRGVTMAATSGATTIDLAKPPNTVAGDAMLAQIVVRGGADVLTSAPPGWLLVLSNDSGSVKSALYERTATNSTPSTFTWSFNSAQQAVGGIVAYAGVTKAFTATVQAVSMWDGTTLPDGSLKFVDCTTASPPSDHGLESVSLKVESADGKTTKTIAVIKRNPCSGEQATGCP